LPSLPSKIAIIAIIEDTWC